MFLGQELRIKLLQHGIKQCQLVVELKKRGYKSMSASYLSGIISGYQTGPTPDAVLKIIKEIINEKELSK